MNMATPVEEAQVERGFRSLAYLFKGPADREKCHRCQQNVYQTERIGPVHGVVFHISCFRCIVCDLNLNMKNYWSNQVDPDDHEVYCNTHHPRIGAARFDGKAMAIKTATDAQGIIEKQSRQSRMPNQIYGPHIDSSAIGIRQALDATKMGKKDPPVQMKAAGFGADAVHIRGPLHAQELLEKKYKKNLDKHHYPAHIAKKRVQLYDAQKKLEEKLREEEDNMFREFQEQREVEKRKLSQEIEKEWEVKLKELTERFEKDNDKKKRKNSKDGDPKNMTVQYENQKKDLANWMATMRDKKKQTMTLRLREKEQMRTATMVKKQSEQMLHLIAQKQQELKRELETELQREKMETMVRPDADSPNRQLENNNHITTVDLDNSMNSGVNGDTALEEAIEVLSSVPDVQEVPKPTPASTRKTDLYSDVNVFNELDEQVIRVAETEQEQVSYTDLIMQLTENIHTDLEKARAIYRWITVKDLNVIEFDDNVDADTPMGLLRGIKCGTETYHVLFMRLCSYAGLHCVEIKGHSKSVGYEPGMKILPEQFQNTWNAVLISGEWRLVQCNWGARHLVLNKDNKNKEVDKDKKKDQIRYQYDEHYFLTDADEFIQEFCPHDMEWELLENPITLAEFENLPFVRSVFFHHGMHFDESKKACIECNERGGAEIKIKVPENLENDLVFFYQLRFADKDRRQETTYRGASLERFVFQTMVDNCVLFSIHVPTIADYFFEIFANKIDDSNKFGEDPNASMMPFRLKCACKFKIICKSLAGKMHPLPNCALGEWGPKKPNRHFGISQLYSEHPSDIEFNEQLKAGIVIVDDEAQLRFQIPRPLHFVAKLRMNNVDDNILDPFVNMTMEGSQLILTVRFPQQGQYGLDLYGRPKAASDTHTLSHAAKYLVNCIKVSSPVEIPRGSPQVALMKKDKWGPTTLFDKLGLKCITHKDPKIKCTDSNHCAIEIAVPERIHVSYQFMREPDEDNKEYVSMVREDNKVVKFFVNLAKTGNYMLALYARKDDDNSKSMPNVYNYLIKYLPAETNGQDHHHKRESIFRKPFFLKKSTDK